MNYCICLECGAHLDPGERCEDCHPHHCFTELPEKVNAVSLIDGDGEVTVYHNIKNERGICHDCC